ncbi:MAG: glycosyltransferase family 4 protein [Chitinispirillaceae bacterium]
MKVLVLNWRDLKHPDAGGAEVHFTELFSRLVKKGYEVTLLTTRFKGSQPRDTQKGIEVLRWGHTYTFNWEAPLLIKKLLKERQFDLIIDDVNKLPFFTPLWFPSIRCGAFFHHLFGKTVFGLTAAPMAAYVYLMEKLYPLVYRKVPCSTVSNSTASELTRLGFPRDKMTIIENSVDTDYYSPDPSLKRESDLLLYTGRLKKYKRVDIIFEAMHVLDKNSEKKLRLCIAGAGDDLPRLKDRSRELGVENRVEFAGYVSEQRKLELFRTAAVFVNTSEKEGWGITNIEASACKTPVVANNAPGLRDSVLHGKTGLLYRENDAHSLAECIQQLLENKNMRNDFGTQGRQWALKFSWDSSAEKVENWLSSILEEK